MGLLEGSEQVRDYSMAAITFDGLFRHSMPESAKDVARRTEELLDRRIRDFRHVNDLVAYVNLKAAQISSLIFSDPEV